MQLLLVVGLQRISPSDMFKTVRGPSRAGREEAWMCDNLGSACIVGRADGGCAPRGNTSC